MLLYITKNLNSFSDKFLNDNLLRALFLSEIDDLSVHKQMIVTSKINEGYRKKEI